jgi:hypothetical protein
MFSCQAYEDHLWGLTRHLHDEQRGISERKKMSKKTQKEGKGERKGERRTNQKKKYELDPVPRAGMRGSVSP